MAKEVEQTKKEVKEVVKEPAKAQKQPTEQPRVRRAYYIGEDNRRNSFITEFENKLKELEDIASKIAPKGLLCVSFGDVRDGYSPIFAGVRSLINSARLFSGQRIMRNPKLAEKLAKVGEHSEAINKIVNAEVKERRQRAREAQAAKQAAKEKREKENGTTKD